MDIFKVNKLYKITFKFITASVEASCESKVLAAMHLRFYIFKSAAPPSAASPLPKKMQFLYEK
jgi:hypothetical protein